MNEPSHEFLRETITEHAPFMGRLARALIGDPERAADLVQDSWAEVLRHPEALEKVASSQNGGGGSRMKGWLAVIMRRRLATQLRGQRTSSELPDSAASPGPEPMETSMRLERQALVHAVLYELEEPERTALVLRFQDDLTAAEIARRTGVPASTVRSRLARGLNKLRDELNRRHPGGEAEWLSALLPLAFPGAAVGGALPVASTSALAPPVLATVLMKNLSLAAALLFIPPFVVVGLRSLGLGEEVQQTAADEEVVALAPALPVIEKQGALAPIERAAARTVAEGASAQLASAANALVREPQQLAGRVTLLDGTPVTGIRISAKPAEGNKEPASGSCELDDEGRFAIQGLTEGKYDLEVAHHWDVQGALVEGVEVPSSDVLLELDAVLLRAHRPPEGAVLPSNLDIDSLRVRSLGVYRLMDEEHDASSMHELSESATSDGAVETLLPTGPGYAVMLRTSVDQKYFAVLAAGVPSSAYDIKFEAESPMLAAAEVVLSGAPLGDNGRLIVSLDFVSSGDENSDFCDMMHFDADRRRGRTGVLLPGSYKVTARSLGFPPLWIAPRVLQPALQLEAGDDALVEVELVKGGGLSLTFETSDKTTPSDGFRLETSAPDSSGWEPHMTYHAKTDSGVTCSISSQPGTPYRSFGALPPGPTRFRLRGEGYRTEEVELFIPTGSLAVWNPVLQKAP